MMIVIVVQVLLFLFPWVLRRFLLNKILGYQIAPTVKIGFSIICAKKVVINSGCRIGHGNFIKGLDLLLMAENSSIGRGNWITGFPSGSKKHFVHVNNRCPAFILGEGSAITHRHLIDCTSTVSIGKYSTLAGFGSQILTHSIDIFNCRQDTSPVKIGDFSFVGTRCIFVHGSTLPSYSVLGAGSILTKQLLDEFFLYGGSPARALKSLDVNSKYFTRTSGFVY